MIDGKFGVTAMRLEATRSFLKLVELGSYAAAAEALYMSTTTLHSHVKSIEAELATVLVKFKGRQLVLTVDGQRFLRFAEHTMGEFDELQDGLSRNSRGARETLRIASLYGPATYLLPPVIHEIGLANPDLSIVVRAGHVDESLAALVSGQADMMIGHEVHATALPGAYTATPVYCDELTAVIRSDFLDAPHEELFEHYPVALQTPSSLSRQYFERWAREHGIAPKARFECDVFEGILSQVLCGGTIGILGGYVARLSPVRDQIAELSLSGFHQRRELVAIHPSTPKPRAKEFINALVAFHGTSTPAPAPMAAVV